MSEPQSYSLLFSKVFPPPQFNALNKIFGVYLHSSVHQRGPPVLRALGQCQEAGLDRDPRLGEGTGVGGGGYWWPVECGGGGVVGQMGMEGYARAAKLVGQQIQGREPDLVC